jgi:membrane-associated phospholipid phosphatase
VFAVSTVMANYLDNTLWKVFWYGSAGLVGAARIYNNKHWVSDVFLGAAIGYFVGRFTVNFDKKDSKYFGMNVTPYFTFNEIGINLRF